VSENPFGREVRAQRLKRQIGLRELSGRLGVTPAYLSDIERGSRTPIESKVRRLAEELGEDENRWIDLAVRARGSIDLPVGTGPGHDRRDEVAMSLHRQWDSITEKMAEKIAAMLEGRDHE